MNCGKYKNMIPVYISGELEDNDYSELSAHLDECAECRAALDSERKIIDVAGVDMHEVPESLNSIILSKLPGSKPSLLINLMRYAVAASFFFLMILSYFLFDTSGTANIPVPSGNYTYSNGFLIGAEYDELISYSTELYDDNKWSSDNVGIFQSEDGLINGLLMLEELESYDTYLTSL